MVQRVRRKKKKTFEDKCKKYSTPQLLIAYCSRQWSSAADPGKPCLQVLTRRPSRTVQQCIPLSFGIFSFPRIRQEDTKTLLLFRCAIFTFLFVLLFCFFKFSLSVFLVWGGGVHTLYVKLQHKQTLHFKARSNLIHFRNVVLKGKSRHIAKYVAEIQR